MRKYPLYYVVYMFYYCQLIILTNKIPYDSRCLFVKLVTPGSKELNHISLTYNLSSIPVSLYSHQSVEEMTRDTRNPKKSESSNGVYSVDRNNI